MKHHGDCSLRPFNTFGVNAAARALVEIESAADVEDVLFDPATDLVLGGGSNVLFAGDVEGTVFLNRIRGRRVVAQDGDHAIVEAAAGENWHELVRWTLAQGLSGLENLSLIPGLVGAAPIQNIGAYGMELAGVLDAVTAWHLVNHEWRSFSNRECRFAYRDSRFKSEEPGRHLIVSIRLRLDRRFNPRLNYAGLGEELDSMGISDPSAVQVSDAVIRIRQRRLPDPAAAGNAGSFFKNPEVDLDLAEGLRGRYPGLPVHRAGAGTAKLGAAWMIERCGWKGFRDRDAGVSAQHALVLVNHGRASGRELLLLARRVRDSVAEEFGVRLEPEAVVIGA